MGARPLGRKINDLIKVPLSKKILFESIPANTIIEVNWSGEEFEFTEVDTFTANVPTVDENGYIILDSM
jgi:ATP-dependent Clp protease ATP-binding subunit ClpA